MGATVGVFWAAIVAADISLVRKLRLVGVEDLAAVMASSMSLFQPPSWPAPSFKSGMLAVLLLANDVGENVSRFVRQYLGVPYQYLVLFFLPQLRKVAPASTHSISAVFAVVAVATAQFRANLGSFEDENSPQYRVWEVSEVGRWWY